ncbi:MAG TPA: FKBP-type peptidyl-prolyl cis-trans isomerase [Candidatus Moranbacteria bacterium]|nr:FKBP-type peptidyl-prolyl cis-trans isomerase [Candidatus Moranbacteria bacterium]HRY28364.1 FKBP-type peptidyl-prolyl cis-trans isomerase [Candidatus Moranbacteria bacterium]HSA07929.1 FKBP-type peptidyl-prolyl cis-trans isomerase [Candidatus Moranbacteria bacterium]
MQKRILILVAIIAAVILVFVLLQKDISAPVDTNQISIQPEKSETVADKSSEKNPDQSGQAQKINNTNNNKTMGLEIKTTQEGTGERQVKTGDTISVHYTGKLTDGTKFDSSVDRGVPFEFTVGQGMVIQGWEQGFLGAKVGEKRTLTIPAEMGYGARAVGSIPANSTLIFDVELVAIK